jgi:two-component system cell cycle sensor histidine kinase/response regulator CckA
MGHNGHPATVRQHVDATLRNGERWLRSILEHASDLVVLADPDGIATYVSPASRRVLGREPRALVGSNVLDLVHPEDAATTRLEFTRLLNNVGSNTPLEIRAQHASGEWRTLLVTGHNRLYDPSVGGVVFNARDITQQRLIELQFQHVQKMEAVGRVAGGIAHDFCTLMSVVQGNAQLALLSMASDAQGYREMREIGLAADRASVLIRQLLTFSRRQEVSMEELRPDRVIEEIQPLLERLLGGDRVLTVTPGARAGSVRMDRSQLEQVLVNVVINARDAMPAGGRATIWTTEMDVSRDFAQMNPGARAGSYVLLGISDSGIGMSSEVLSRIFEPFYTTKARGKGTGLGLSTVYGIVQRSGGFVLVDSVVGAGSTFRIYLPRAA